MTSHLKAKTKKLFYFRNAHIDWKLNNKLNKMKKTKRGAHLKLGI